MKKSVVILSVVFAFTCLQAKASPARPGKIIYVQPDGKKITTYLRGDEFMHYYESEDGAVLLPDHDGVLRYASVSADGNVIPSQVRASDISERGAEEKAFVKMQDSLLIRKIICSENRQKRINVQSKVNPETIKNTFPTTGVVNGLIILAEYSDVKFQPNHTREVYDELANKEGYDGEHASGSIFDYFVSQSYGKFKPHFDVVGPVTLPHEMKYYGTEELVAEMVKDACNEAKDKLGTDFSKYDANGDGNVDFVFVIYAGYGESQGGSYETVWPQKVDLTYESWKTYDGLYLGNVACSCELRGNSGTELDGIGTFCHEFSHILGLPDVYDTSVTGTGFGMGCWDVMDIGLYLNDSRTPAGYTAMDKYSLGWISPKVLSEPTSNLSLGALSETDEAYFIVCEDNGREYFTLENRQNSGWDKELPGHGMIISQIHYVPSLWSSNRVNASGNDYDHISLVAADNDKSADTYSSDTYPGTSGVTSFTDDTTPAASWHTTSSAVGCPITNIREEQGVIFFDFKRTSTDVPHVTADNGLTLSTDNGVLKILNPREEVVTVLTADGRIVSSTATAEQTINTGKGIYIVSCNGLSEKIVIK